MPKANSPMRLEQELVADATGVARRYRRSVAEQVEYWAALGRSVERVLDADAILEVQAGLARIELIPTTDRAIAAETVFAALEQDRADGRLADTVASGGVRYQASPDHPGLLERIDAHGKRSIGHFKDGEFRAADDNQQ